MQVRGSLTYTLWRSRVALLERLATVPEASFDEADLHQLFQARVLLDPPGARPSLHLRSCCACRHWRMLGSALVGLGALEYGQP